MFVPRSALIAGFVLAALPLSSFACGGRLHVEIEDTGVYALDFATIAEKQPELADCRADELVLTQRGREVPIRIVGASDGRIGPGAHIEWVGRQLHGPESWFDPYSLVNVYLLGAAPGHHARIIDRDYDGSVAAPLVRHRHFEEENQFIRLDQSQQLPGREPDVWQWAKLTHVDPKPFTTTFRLDDFAARGEVRVTLDFRGLSQVDPPPKFKGDKPADHEVAVAIDGKPVATLEWNGRDEIRREIEVPAGILKSGDNVLSLSVPKRALPWDAKADAVDVVMFNWIAARFPIGGDLDDGALPLGTGARGAAELRWRGKGTPVLYGSDGVRRIAHARGERYAYAAADPGVDLFPVFDDQLLAPTLVRAVADRDWTRPEHGYDYLVVAHPSLIDAIRPLAEFHEKRGMKVAVLDVDDVYDEFNHGIANPRAIRNLVDRAYHEWPAPALRFLLLVGDSSYDIRHDTYQDINYAKWTDRELLFPGHFGSIPGTPYKDQPKKLADRNLIPTWQYPSAEGQSASDNGFASVGIDEHPVIAVGRFPVVKPEEVSAIVDKTIDYMSKPTLGRWRRDVMFITDELLAFKNASDDIASSLADEGFVADKVYASPKETDNAAHQTAIRDGIDDGRLIVHFIGHGGRYIWRTGPPDLRKNNDLFTLDDVGSLKNRNQLPMVLSMTCYSAPFDNPAEDSIGEKFLREPNRGAIAVFAASWRNSPSPAFSKAVIDELLKPDATIGEAIMRAKSSIYDRTLIEMYNLLGDPAVVLERPRDAIRIERDGDRRDPGVLVDVDEPRFDGQLVVDWMDKKGNKLVSNTYSITTPTVHLRIPHTAGDAPASIRVYASSPGSGRDAVGGLELKPLAKERPWTAELASWWRDVTRPAYKPPPRTADTISMSDFDDPNPKAHTPAQDAAYPSPSATAQRER